MSSGDGTQQKEGRFEGRLSDGSPGPYSAKRLGKPQFSPNVDQNYPSPSTEFVRINKDSNTCQTKKDRTPLRSFLSVTKSSQFSLQEIERRTRKKLPSRHRRDSARLCVQLSERTSCHAPGLGGLFHLKQMTLCSNLLKPRVSPFCSRGLGARASQERGPSVPCSCRLNLN